MVQWSFFITSYTTDEDKTNVQHIADENIIAFMASLSPGLKLIDGAMSSKLSVSQSLTITPSRPYKHKVRLLNC